MHGTTGGFRLEAFAPALSQVLGNESHIPSLPPDRWLPPTDRDRERILDTLDRLSVACWVTLMLSIPYGQKIGTVGKASVVISRLGLGPPPVERLSGWE